MNKHKKALTELRAHLGRDRAGLNLLDDVARALTDQRKQIALLEEKFANSEASLSTIRKDLGDEKIKTAQIRQALETQTSRWRAAAHRATRAEELYAEAVHVRSGAGERGEEGDAAEGHFSGNDAIKIRQAKNLLKRVKKRFSSMPISQWGKQRFGLEEVAPNLTGDELMGLGELIACLAIHGFPAVVAASRILKDFEGSKSEDMSDFIYWYRSWIEHSGKRIPIVNEDP